MFGFSKLWLYAVAAVALGAGVVWGIGAIREDARNDLLKDLLIQQTERDEENAAMREILTLEIEDESVDERRARACALGMLPPDACP